MFFSPRILSGLFILTLVPYWSESVVLRWALPGPGGVSSELNLYFSRFDFKSKAHTFVVKLCLRRINNIVVRCMMSQKLGLFWRVVVLKPPPPQFRPTNPPEFLGCEEFMRTAVPGVTFDLWFKKSSSGCVWVLHAIVLCTGVSEHSDPDPPASSKETQQAIIMSVVKNVVLKLLVRNQLTSVMK